MSNRTRQNNKRADTKMKSNDSPEISERGGGGHHQKSPASIWTCLEDTMRTNYIFPDDLNPHCLTVTGYFF